MKINEADLESWVERENLLEPFNLTGTFVLKDCFPKDNSKTLLTQVPFDNLKGNLYNINNTYNNNTSFPF